MEQIHEFMNQLLTDKGITGIEDDVRQRLIEDMTTMLLDQIDQNAIAALPDDKADELNAKLESGELKDEQVADFMAEAGVDLQQISLTTMIQFRELYLGTADASQEYNETQKSAEVTEDKEQKAENRNGKKE